MIFLDLDGIFICKINGGGGKVSQVVIYYRPSSACYFNIKHILSAWLDRAKVGQLSTSGRARLDWSNGL